MIYGSMSIRVIHQLCSTTTTTTTLVVVPAAPSSSSSATVRVRVGLPPGRRAKSRLVAPLRCASSDGENQSLPSLPFLAFLRPGPQLFFPSGGLTSAAGNGIRIFSPSSTGMEVGATTALYPLHRCKTIYLVRHAQGIHNVAGEKDFNAYMSHDLFDAQLTPLGWSQVDGLREHVKKSGLAEKIELVISSPLLRTMQTAVGVFGGDKYTDGVNAPPLMAENAGHSGRPAVSSLNCPPFIAVETCREHLGVHPCDKRRSITEYRPLFPGIDFSLIENDEDVLWEPDVRETNEAVALRGMKFFDWLWTREEKEIAIVSHSGFLFHTLSMYSKECHPTIRDEVSTHFANCELRSMLLVDRSMLGSYSPRFNYPGKIPAGPDLPSDITDKHHEEAEKN